MLDERDARPTFDVPVEELERDPYPIYARLRRDAPVCWVPSVGMWLATRWDDALTVATDTERFRAHNEPVDRAFGAPNVLSCEGAIHKELRATLNPTMRPSVVDDYIDGLVEPIARAQLARLLEGPGRAEIMEGYFEPISVRSLASVLGMAGVGDETLRRWFAAMALGASNYERDPVKQAQSDAVIAELEAYLDPLLTQLESAPDDSLISHMLWVGRDDGVPRPRDLVLPTLKVLILGGMQEPGHGAGTVLWHLLDNPEQLAAVRADMDRLLPAAIEEGMRLVAPIHTQARTVVVDTELAGVRLPAGDAVAAVIASANRDDERFEDPDTFDVHRPKRRVATFGFGAHFCSGHAFARALERIALRVLLEEVPTIALVPGEETHFAGFEFRAPRRMPVAWQRATEREVENRA
jgi:cytochrome P450